MGMFIVAFRRLDYGPLGEVIVASLFVVGAEFIEMVHRDKSGPNFI